jgi:hypothetical protein
MSGIHPLEGSVKRFNFAGFVGIMAVMVGLLAVAYIAGAASASSGGTDQPRGLSGLLQSFAPGSGASGNNLLERSMKQLKENYFMEITPEEEKELRYAAIQGMLGALRPDL